MGEKIKKDWYNGQKGKYEDKMIFDTLSKKFFFNFANVNIRYSPMQNYNSQQSCVFTRRDSFCILIIGAQFRSDRSKICSMTLKSIKKGV
jgi:hypothetical protein